MVGLVTFSLYSMGLTQVPSRSQKSHSWDQASYVGFGNGMPVPNGSSGYSENVRPVSQSYNGPRQIGRRAPGEVVVLE